MIYSSSNGREIDFEQFKTKFLERGEVEKIVIIGDIAKIYTKDGKFSSYYFTIGDANNFELKLEKIQSELGWDVQDWVPVKYKYVSEAPYFSAAFAVILAFIFIAAVSNTKMDMMSQFKSKAKTLTKKEMPTTKFKDVAGLDEAKVEIMEFVSFLKTPEKYTLLGAKIPRGALLVGPPGTGKTLIAKATAGEAGVPIFSTSGSDFIEMYGGLGSSRVRDLFSEARKKAPCIIFIDEIDAIGRSRNNSGMSNSERENTLNQLLVEMDGFNTQGSVIVLAGTNRLDILDKALLRPGRFDRTITIDPPTKAGRIDIFKVHLKNIKLSMSMDTILEKLADLTPGFVGADIANVCNESAIIAARANKNNVELSDIELAIERVVGGLERKSKVLDPLEKKTVAYHEAGHALCGWLLEHTDPILKVSIIPRGASALGYSQSLPKDQYLRSKEQIFDNICMALGGRAAENIIFNESSTGAQDDLKRVTNMAFNQVTKYGMSEKIGLFSFKENKENQFSERLYSDNTAMIIDSEIQLIIQNAYQRVFDLLNTNLEKLELVAQKLLDKEVLTNADMTEMLGPRPYSKQNESENIPKILS